MNLLRPELDNAIFASPTLSKRSVTSVFTDEKNAAITALSQQFRRRLIEHVMPYAS